MALTATAADGTVSISQDDQQLLRYRAETEASKPHFDVVNLPAGAGSLAGQNLVLSAPHDHAWHLGLFFCPKLVDGINCWESEGSAAHNRTHGYATSRDYSVSDSDDAVYITQRAEWKTDAGESLLEDTREIEIHQPNEREYLIVWDQGLRALEQRRNLSSETLHGHYSGLSARFIRSFTRGTIRTDNLSEEEESNGAAGRWCDYSGAIDGKIGSIESWMAGITLMDHPNNSSHPTNWFTSRENFGFVAANPTWNTVLTLDRDETISWTWGIWVHANVPTRKELADAYDTFESLTPE